METFGNYVKSLRAKKEITLREFCQRADIDPSNWSKIERGLMPPFKSKQVLDAIASALEVKPNSDEYNTLFDLAAISHIPTQLITDQDILEKLPIFFRTVRGDSPSKSELLEIVKLIKES
jgi:transcriptional regulator with XRE-family HTH domain